MNSVGRPINDLSGMKFGSLNVIARYDRGECVRYLCKCDCGKEFVARAGMLKDGRQTHCGCGKYDHLIGSKFGKLTVIGWGKNGKKVLLRCKCDCGNVYEGLSKLIRNGSIHTCGCRNKGHKRLGKPWNKNKDSSHAAKMEVYRDYLRGAKKRCYEFDITFDEFVKLTQRNCHYCGNSPSQIRNRKSSKYIYNGLDRVDNAKGYVEGNVVTCCSTCNRAKYRKTTTEFRKWVVQIYTNMHS